MLFNRIDQVNDSFHVVKKSEKSMMWLLSSIVVWYQTAKMEYIGTGDPDLQVKYP